MVCYYWIALTNLLTKKYVSEPEKMWQLRGICRLIYANYMCPRIRHSFQNSNEYIATIPNLDLLLF
jgi:hypothetical protein